MSYRPLPDSLASGFRAGDRVKMPFYGRLLRGVVRWASEGGERHVVCWHGESFKTILPDARVESDARPWERDERDP